MKQQDLSWLLECSTNEVIRYGNKVQEWYVWDFIMSNCNLPLPKAIELVIKLGDWGIWQILLKRSDLPVEVAISFVKTIQIRRGWETILERTDVKNVITNLSPKEAVDLAREAEDNALTKFVYSLVCVQEFTKDLRRQAAFCS